MNTTCSECKDEISTKGTEVEGETLCIYCRDEHAVFVKVPEDCGETDFWAWR